MRRSSRGGRTGPHRRALGAAGDQHLHRRWGRRPVFALRARRRVALCRAPIHGVPANETGGFFKFAPCSHRTSSAWRRREAPSGTLYGFYALAGVVSLQTAPLDGTRRLRGSAGGGDLGTSSFSVSGNGSKGALSGSLSLGADEDRQRGPERGLPLGPDRGLLRTPVQPGCVDPRILPVQRFRGRHARALGVRPPRSLRRVTSGTS